MPPYAHFLCAAMTSRCIVNRGSYFPPRFESLSTQKTVRGRLIQSEERCNRSLAVFWAYSSFPLFNSAIQERHSDLAQKKFEAVHENAWVTSFQFKKCGHMRESDLYLSILFLHFTQPPHNTLREQNSKWKEISELIDAHREIFVRRSGSHAFLGWSLCKRAPLIIRN